MGAKERTTDEGGEWRNAVAVEQGTINKGMEGWREEKEHIVARGTRKGVAMMMMNEWKEEEEHMVVERGASEEASAMGSRREEERMVTERGALQEATDNGEEEGGGTHGYRTRGTQRGNNRRKQYDSTE